MAAAAQALFGLDLQVHPDRVREALDPAENVRLRTVTGGPAPENVRQAVAKRRRELSDSRADLAAVLERTHGAYAALVAQAKAFAGGGPAHGSGQV